MSGGGWNFIDGTSQVRVEDDGLSPNSSITHGQCSASIIASEADNGIGMVGVFHLAEIMPLQSDGHISEAIVYAVNNGADVILVAGGGGKDAGYLWPMYKKTSEKPAKRLYTEYSLRKMKEIIDALDFAYHSGVPVISGVGNTGRFGMTLISDHHSSISVGPHNIFGEVAKDTSFSYSFDIFAPGGSRKVLDNFQELGDALDSEFRVFPQLADFDDPLCAVGKDEYSFLTLGSAAMPHVAGAVAMVKSFIPNAGVEEIRQMLRSSSIPLAKSDSLLEGRAGRLSLKLLKSEIDSRMQ